ncbi:MAG: glycerol-3-phosphate dehydrogenase/oxidase, partial [Deltaproteobacteria bacterium]|nr:glycerol-3-phosphate dehydrogenase/oxidase [Deltaproteobacteria bacterium]
MNRVDMLSRLDELSEPFDILFIGGGATGVGAAIDAASRGHRVALLEQSDFGKGTSSRSTKLVHGGVRYLQQGNLPLVMEALRERGIMRKNAPHLVSDLAFVVPNYTWWEAPFYGLGMKIYDLLAGRYGFGHSRLLDVDAMLERIPTIERSGLRGGVVYYDGQFDDARMLISMVQTAVDHGAVMLNYVRVTGLRKNAAGLVDGVFAREHESRRSYELAAKVVVNCTGPFADQVRLLDDCDTEPIIAASTGSHIVLDRSFLPGDSAIMVPHTPDGRVMFAIPWHGKVIVGTTDVPVEERPLEPVPSRED